MIIRGRAPLRVSFGGGGTDVAPFCDERGGAIIGSTINKYACCSIVPRQDDNIIVHSLDFDMTVKYNTKENYVYDGSLVMGNLMLAAHELGLGSCWIHRAKEEFETDWGKELLKSLGIEEEYEGIGHCALGYIDGEYPEAAKRKENRVFYITED